MARRATRRVGPPTPIPSQREQARRVEANLASYQAENAARRRNLEKALRARKRGSAFDTAHALLQETTNVDWSKARHKPIAYWDERWEFRTKSKRVAWEEIADWQSAIQQDNRVTSYLEGKALSIMVELWDREQGRGMTLTAAAARDFDTAMTDMESKLGTWAEKYGRDVMGDDEHSYIRSIDVLIRGDGVHSHWPGVVRGRAKMREAKIKRGKRRRLRR